MFFLGFISIKTWEGGGVTRMKIRLIDCEIEVLVPKILISYHLVF